MDHTHADARLNQSSGLTTSRIEALSDGIFAIAMTILVLDFRLSTNLAGGQFMAELYAQAPHFISYFLSFIALGTLWIGHHNQFYWIRYSNRTFLWINIFFLMLVVLIPFSTTVVSAYRAEQLSVALYGGNLMVCAILLYYHWRYATRGHRLVDKDLSHELVDGIKQKELIGIACYILALFLSFVSRLVPLALFTLAQIIAIAPSKTDKIITTPNICTKCGIPV